MILFHDFMNVYIDLMQKAVKKVEYFSEKDLEKVHLRAIDECMTKVCQTNFDFNQLNGLHFHKITISHFFL